MKRASETNGSVAGDVLGEYGLSTWIRLSLTLPASTWTPTVVTVGKPCAGTEMICNSRWPISAVMKKPAVSANAAPMPTPPPSDDRIANDDPPSLIPTGKVA